MGIIFALALGVASCPSGAVTVAHAENGLADSGAIWTAHPVLFPVPRQSISPSEPIADSAEIVHGPVEVGPDRTALLWLDTLRAVRVRLEDPTQDAGLAFGRVIGGSVRGSAQALVEEPGVFVEPGVYYLVQPPSVGAVWFVTAKNRARVHIESIELTRGHVAWESMQRTILDWIDSDAEELVLPPFAGVTEFRSQLQAERVLADAIGAANPDTSRLQRAARAWRKASAVRQLMLLRPLLTSYFRVTPIEAQLADIGPVLVIGDNRPYYRVEEYERTWRVELEGPGVLRIDARALLNEARIRDGAGTLGLRVLDEDRTLGATTTSPVAVLWARQEEDAPSDDPDRPDDTDDDLLIPVRREYVVPGGEFLGNLRRLTVPLRPGRHSYTIEVAGGPMAVRVTHAMRRPFSREAITDSEHEGDYARHARRALDGDDSVPAALLRHMLADIDGEAADTNALLEAQECDGLGSVLCALLQVQLVTMDVPPEIRTEVLARARKSLARMTWEPGWYLRSVLAVALYRSGHFTDLRRLLRAAEKTPPTPLLARLAEILPPPLTFERSRSRPIALMDLAWRAAPLDPDVRARYRELWREQSTWSRLTPTDDSDRRLRDITKMWLRRDDGALGSQGSWGRLANSKPVTVLAPQADIDRSRPAVLRLAVVSCAKTPGPITVRIDDMEWSAVALRAVERWEFAVAPGEHTLTIDAPECVSAYASLPEVGKGGYEGAAWVERAWPLQIGERPVRYDLPAPHVQGPIQIRLRALMPGDHARTGVVLMKTDLGTSRRIEVEWKNVDGQTSLVDENGLLSDYISFVMSPPVGAQHIWFETSDDMPIFASVFVRRPTEEAARTAGESATPPTPSSPLQELAEISAAIDDRDPDTQRLLRRAHLFLDLGFPDLARRDAKRAASGARDTHDESVRRAYRALLIRLDKIREPAHLPASSPAGEALTPVALVPADLSLPGRPSQALVDAVRDFRQRPNRDAVTALDRLDEARAPRTRYLKARIFEWYDDHLQAGRELTHLAQDVQAWQVLREAAIALGYALEDAIHSKREGDESNRGLAALTYGVARDLDDRGTLPMVRKVLFLASELSRWTGVRSANHTSGYQRLMIEQDPGEDNPRTQVNNAMVAAPWRQHLQIFRPGRSAALKINLREKTPLYADLWCRQVKLPRPGEIPVCRVTVLVDSQPQVNALDGVRYDETPLELGRVLRFATGPLAPGPHQIEVKLSHESRIHRAAVRFSSNRELPDSAQPIATDNGLIYPLQVRSPATSLMAGSGPNRHIELTVNGPTALHLTSRSSHEDPAKRLDIDIRSTTSASRHRRNVSLRAEHDPDAALREGPARIRELTVATSTVIPIPDPGPHLVRIAPDSGLVYVRVLLREERRDAEPSEAISHDLTERPDNELLRWPGAAPEIHLLEASYPHRPRAEGTFSVEAAVRTNDLEDSDNLPQVTKLDITIGWRRQLIEDHIWVYAGMLARRHFDGRYILGARARMQNARLPGGMRGFGELQIFTQMIESELEWSAYGRFDIDRPVRLAPDWTLIPRLSMRSGSMSISFDRIPRPGPEIDPDIYSVYRYFHRHTTIPRLSLRWQPFQDHVGSVDVAAVPNTDLASLDRVELTVRWNTLLHITRWRTALTQLSYRPSYRYYDEDRFDAYVRHDLRASAVTNLWTGRTGRLQAHAQATLYLSELYGTSTTFVVGLAYDITAGRGLRDFFSFEEEFDPYVEGRMWVYDER